MAFCAEALAQAAKALTIQQCVMFKKHYSEIFIMELSWLGKVLFIDAMHVM